MITGLLFGGLTDPTALDVAIERCEEDTIGYLAMNLNLSSEQITAILDKSGQLQRVTGTSYTGGAVMIASRGDLTSEHIVSILEGKNSTVRQALLLRPKGVPLSNLSQEIVLHATKQSWFNDDWAKHLNELIYESHYLLIAKVPYDIPEKSYLQSNAAHQQRIRFTKEIRSVYNFRDYGELDEVMIARISAQLAVPLGAAARLFFCSKFGELLQSEIGSESRSFYEIFFSLLPTWDGSLLELVSSTKSLVSRPGN